MQCSNCGSVLGGKFQVQRGPFEELDCGQAEFLRLFIVSRGNLREVGRKLGVSYPTVRAKLDGIVAALEVPVAPGLDT